MTAALELFEVTQTYPGNPPVCGLDNVNLRVERGGCVAIVGSSGSGKSTLLATMGTLDRPSSGEVFVEGYPTKALDDAELTSLRSTEIGFVFQNFHLLDNLDATANVAAGLVYQQVGRHERSRRAHSALDSVGLAHRCNHRPQELSGGERQRVAIARALVSNPSIILADEPTGNLDSESGDLVLELLFRLNDRGVTLVTVTHDSDLALVFDRQIVVHDGRLSEQSYV